MTSLAPALLCAALAAAPVAKPVQLASPGLSGLNLAPDALAFYSEHLAQQFRLSGMKVHTAGDIAAVLGLERQRQLLGCAEDATSCTVELANALGADGVVVGHLAKLGETYQLDVRILAAASGDALAVRSAKARGEEALSVAMDQMAAALVVEIHQRLGRAPAGPTAPVVTASGASRKVHKAWIPASVGLVATLVGMGLWGDGLVTVSDVRDKVETTPPRLDLAEEKIRAGQTEANIGVWVMTAGMAAGIGAAIWRLTSIGSSAPVEAGVAVGPSGAAVTVGGTLPWP